MRRRVTRVAVVAAVVAMTLFAVPLAVVSRSLLLERELAELQVTALAATRAVTSDPTDPVELPPTDEVTTLAVYGTDGRRTAGDGPTSGGTAVTAALRGTPTRGPEGDRVVAAVPVVSDERVVAVVEASESRGEVWRQVALAWGLLTAGAVLALTVGVAVARRQSRRLVRPLEELTATAVRIGEGDLGVRARRSDVLELDGLATAQNTMVDALSEVLDRERRFSADASHQLRTPLARLGLRLEAAEADPGTVTREWVRQSRADIAHLQDTVADVLHAARAGASTAGPAAPTEPLGAVVAAAEDRWRGPLAERGRRLESEVADDVAAVPVAGRTVGHVVDVLLENALTHGRGRVRLVARAVAGALAVDVLDEGEVDVAVRDPFERGVTTGSGSGVGLSMARTMASAAQARLVLSDRAPTRFTLFVPTPPEMDQ
ncbi:HAMP domain-containing histidine kinase [Phycicoccus sp. MAQZ13P-2]|uniref:sensor histidine kinase n=1 Tax=Phycicoccus mangrovi TaxID=2840470 RepID=UPI001BFFEF6A|nr:HAMP domain-containing sensor histidine kinase [Phycicoccus mangrovi]MBT9257136.1 HAMP domain-containing histidine kinase [Phycicoccus mangrovi]MBT9276365.1 HAMP domain-containing histidine kinase [Phycicoccus mangrovi]